MRSKCKHILLSVLGGLAFICLAIGTALHLSFVSARAEEEKASTVSYDTVGVHDPSVVLAYEAGGKSYPVAGPGRTKVYYVFGTQAAQAYSTDLVNWHSFTNDLNNASIRRDLFTDGNYAFSGHTTDSAQLENLWAPDVIWNPVMQKWCMYLTINGPHYNSSIVLLTSDYLRGASWEFKGTIVYSGIYEANRDNGAASVTKAVEEYNRATGRNAANADAVDAKYHLTCSSRYVYGVNAIDACVKYDENGDLWMSYGSWFGGIYMLKLDKNTGLRDYTPNLYSDDITGSLPANGAADSTFTVNEDKYLGIHVAGGHGVSGEGSYILKIGDYYYMYLSYGGYAPDGGYNMRLFRSTSITGPYTDPGGTPAVASSHTGNTEESVGLRVMSGYQWSWWTHAYVAQGHNSAFTDDDNNSYLIYHNKYMDGSAFHVMKTHRILVNDDGWLVTAPFETTEADEVATDLTGEDIAGTYGVLFMTRNNGRNGSPCTEKKVTLTANAAQSGNTITGTTDATLDSNAGAEQSGTWTYYPDTGKFTLRVKQVNYKGYLLYQNMEGTNMRTLALTIISTDTGNITKYTYWGYKYPTAEKAIEYAESTFPNAADPNAYKQADYSVGFGTVVEARPSLNGLTLTANANGQKGTEKTVLMSDTGSVKYSALSVGSRMLPLNLSDSEDISLKFDVKGVSSVNGLNLDWTTVFSGKDINNGFNLNLGTLNYGAWRILEASGNFSNGYTWNAFGGNSTVKLTLLANGGLQFYKNNDLVLTYAGATTFDGSSKTISQFTAAVRAAIKAGTLTCAYPMTNVEISGAGSLGISTTNEITTYETAKGNTQGYHVAAIPNAETTGVAVSFKLNQATNDWDSKLIEVSGMIIAMPNLNSWSNTAGFTTETNMYPLTENKVNGGDWNSFLNTTGFVTVSFDKTNGIQFFKDGTRLIHYPVTQYIREHNATSLSTTVTIGGFVDALLAQIAQKGFTFTPTSFTPSSDDVTISATDLIVTSATSETQAVSLIADYNDIANQTAYRAAVNALVVASTRVEKMSKIADAETRYEAVGVTAGVADAYAIFEEEIAALVAGDTQAIADFKAAVQSANAETDLTAKAAAIEAAKEAYTQVYDKENTEVVQALAQLTQCENEYKALKKDRTAQAAFRTAVGAIATAQTDEAKLAAIRNAYAKYQSVTDKTAVATEYNQLIQAIEAYNAHAEEVNGELQSATEVALKAFSAAIAGIGAIALVWAVLKKVL